MTDKILCPWCGAEMRVYVDENSLFNYNGWTACTNDECTAEGPLVTGLGTEKEAIEAARAAALRRYTPRLKPMTLEEVLACDDDRPMFNEFKGHSDFVRGWGRTAKVMCQGYYRKREYGIEYRYWPDRKPTEEEREAAAWET